jgi:NADH-quinone oxidoreductase subunit L
VGLITAVLTAFYMMRLYLLTFEGEARAQREIRHHIHESPSSMTVPLIILAVLSVIGGYMGLPEFMGKVIGVHDSNMFEKFLASSVLVEEIKHLGDHAFGHWTLVLFSIIAAFLGIILAFYVYVINPSIPGSLVKSPAISFLYRGSYAKWFVDEIYHVLFVRTFVSLSTIAALFDVKVIDGAVNGIATGIKEVAAILRNAQTGILRFYAALMAIGAMAILIYVVLSVK